MKIDSSQIIGFDKLESSTLEKKIDKYTKGILTVIAVALIGILFKDVMIMDANAAMDISDYKMIKNSLRDIVYAIQGISLSCN